MGMTGILSGLYFSALVAIAVAIAVLIHPLSSYWQKQGTLRIRKASLQR